MEQPISSKYIPALNGWRVLLIGMISWYHIWQQSWLRPSVQIASFTLNMEPYVRAGYMMVDGIILLSAFLLFLPYARHRILAQKTSSIGIFYLNRVKRIVPSYYVYLLGMLVLVALPQMRYASRQDMGIDLLRHITFTHTFFRQSYVFSPMGMVVWTLAIEMQAYLLFPFIGRHAEKRPAVMMLTMIVFAFLYRGLVMKNATDYTMLVNQLPAFLDVYAIGMGFSLFYVYMVEYANRHRWVQMLFSVLGILCLLWTLALIRHQATLSGQMAMHTGQLLKRFPLALAFGGLFVSSALALPLFRWLLGNRVTSFLAGLTLNYYMWHTAIAQLLKQWHLPPYENDMPQMAQEQPWQWQYTCLCFALSILVSFLLTYVVEKPFSKGIDNLSNHLRRHYHERSQNGTTGT